MKLSAFIAILALLFSSCTTPGEVRNFDVQLKTGNDTFAIKWVALDNQGTGIYVVYPVSKGLTTLPEQTTFRQSKTTTTVVTLK